MIVLDASLMLAWLLSEPGLASRPQLHTILMRETLLVPAHWPAEVGNALVVNMRRGRIAQEDVADILQNLATFAVSPQTPPETEYFSPLLQFAEAHRLTFYDAIYVQLALETESKLATLDEEMRKAAFQLDIKLLPV